jgi:membrane protein DedA with SNARE-associated domain
MDGFTEQSQFHQWLLQYGSLSLFFLLAMGVLVIVIPIPEETLMVVAGALMNQGKLFVLPTFVAAYSGAMFGITVSYFLGKMTEKYVIHRYGPWLGINQEKIARAHQWFERFGRWALFFGYFIPGVRHFTGLLAGMTSLSYKEFALFAYSGAIIWVTIFLSLGYFFGHYWLKNFQDFEFNLEKFIIFLLTLLIVVIIYKFFSRRKK